MSYSFNETEALCRKAARGAGFSWGMAEEAGRAARWLEQHGLKGAAALADLLRALDGKDFTDIAPDPTGEIWQSGNGAACPICSGTILADHAHLLQSSLIRLNVMHPIFLLPFAAIIARKGNAICLEWDGVQFTAMPEGACLSGRTNAPRANATCRITSDTAGTPIAPRTRADLRPDIYAALDHFAQRTYAPATEASRLAGAGAGLTDND